MIPWRGFDTETQAGRAVLLGTDRKTLDFPKDIRAAFDFLSAEGSRFVAWNMDYDARALVALLPRRTWRRLHLLGTCEARGVRVHYLKGKRFRLVRGRCGVSIYDAMQFYGGGLDRRAREILGEGKAEIPRGWYEHMGDLLRAGGPRAEKIRAYCRRDAGLVLRLYSHLEAQFRAARAPVTEPLSPAYVAATRFRRRLTFALPAHVNYMLRRAYHGARIELWRRGRVGPWRSHDIRSAYPAVLATAPDPRGGTFVERAGRGLAPHPQALYGAYYCRIAVPEGCPVPPFPYRARQGLAYPCGTWEGWYDRESVTRWPEYVAEITHAAEILHTRRAPLFPDLVDIYQERKRRPECALALKLLLNGLYGRLAMTVDRPRRLRSDDPVSDETFWVDGEAWEAPETPVDSTHFGIAAYVTARTRIALWEALSLAPERVIACATDAVYWTGTHRVPGLAPADRLGGWDSGDAGADSLWVQPGVYSLKAEGEWHDKVRGFRATRPLRACLDVRRKVARVPVTWVNTLGHTARGADPELFNVIRPWNRTLDPNADWKRAWPALWRLARDLLRKVQRSESLVVSEDRKA